VSNIERRITGPGLSKVAPGTRMKPHVVFWLVAGLNGLLLVFLTPPFEVHDEFQHFFRTYQLSEGTLWGVVQAGRVGGVLPTSLAELVLRTWGTLGIWTVPPTHVHPLGQTWSEFSLPLQPSLRAFADFSGAASYSPLPYAPQATAIALGRWLECPPLALLYAGRVANAAASISLVAWAIRILPSGRDVALVIALLPMAQYEYSSVAPDGLIIATAFLFTALSLEAAQCGRWVAWKAIVAAIAAAVFCSIKPPYAPLLLLSFLPAWERGARRTRGLALIAAVAVTGFALTVTWAWLKSVWFLLRVPMSSDIDGRMAAMFIHPRGLVTMLLRDVYYHGTFYIMDAIGIFGATVLGMPFAAYTVPILAVALAVAGDRQSIPMTNKGKLLFGAVVVLTFGALQSALLVVLPYSGTALLQGRYLLPIGFVVAAMLASLAGGGKRFPPANRWLGVSVVIMSLLMDYTLITGFHILG